MKIDRSESISLGPYIVYGTASSAVALKAIKAAHSSRAGFKQRSDNEVGVGDLKLVVVAAPAYRDTPLEVEMRCPKTGKTIYVPRWQVR